jgi:hypothetical protein
LRGFGSSSPACSRTAAVRRIGIIAIVINIEMRRVERKSMGEKGFRF